MIDTNKADKSLICCGKKPIQGDLYLTSINMGAALLHFLLAVGIVTTLSFWKVHEENVDNVLMGKIFNFSSMACAIVLTIYSIRVVNDKRPQDKVWGRSKQGSTTLFIAAWVVIAFASLGLAYSAPWINGTFPVYVTISPNTASPTYPYNSTVCNGKDYAADSVFDWIQCIRDEDNTRTRKIFDVKTGELKDWVNNANKGCADAAVVCSDVIENGYSSNQACVKCGGGQECKGRTCYISDNPNSFIQVSGLDSDPSSFIQVGVPQVIIPYEEIIRVNVDKVKTLNAANNKWELVSVSTLALGDPIKFYHKGTTEGPYDSGVWKGNEEAEHQRAWYNWWFLYAFCILTSGVHTLLAVSGWNETADKPKTEGLVKSKKRGCMSCCNEWGYLQELEMGRQPYRWLEYSITASVMFFIVLQLNRVTDLWIILTTFLLTVNYNVFGAAVDLTDNVIFIGWFWTVSFIAFVVQFILLFYNTDKTIEPYFDDSLPTRDLWVQLFGFVRIVNITILWTFLTFPILNIVHLYYKLNKKKWVQSEDDSVVRRNCMYRAEIGYVILSFASKAQLVFLVFWGVASRND